MSMIQFGKEIDQCEYFDMPESYAIICNDRNEIGIVEHNGLYFLPGGGIENGETAVDAVLREVREETGIKVEIERFIGNANEYQRSNDKIIHFNQIGYFYKCKVVSNHHDQSDFTHEFKWLDLSANKSRIARRSHIWALNLAINNFDQFQINDNNNSVIGNYRLIRENELSKLCQLYTHLHKNDEYPLMQDEIESVWKEILSNPRILYFVAELNGEIISSCHMVIIPNLTRGCRPYGTIENVVTKDDFRNKGIGKGILKYALNTAWAFGCYKVMLMTGSQKEWVHKFYQDAGFEKNVKTAFLAKP